MFHLVYHVSISAHHQVGQRYPTAIFSTTSAADTDALRPSRWYEPIIRMTASRRSLVSSYTTITAAAGVHITSSSQVGYALRVGRYEA